MQLEQRLSNYTSILDLTFDFNGLDNGNYKRGRESFQFWDLVHVVLAVWRQLFYGIDIKSEHAMNGIIFFNLSQYVCHGRRLIFMG